MKIFEVSLAQGKLQLHQIGTTIPSSSSKFTRKFAVDRERKIALLTSGNNIHAIFRKDGRSLFIDIDYTPDKNAAVGGLCSLEGGKFVCVVPAPHSGNSNQLMLFKTLNFVYLDFKDLSQLPEIRTVRTDAQIADGLNSRCVVHGPYLVNGKYLFSAGMDFHLYDSASHKPVYSTTFYSRPSRLLVLQDIILAFDDSYRKIRMLNISD